MAKFFSSMVILGLLVAAPLQAQSKLDLSAITREVEQLRSADSRITIVMWMPEQFWRASFQSSGRVTDDSADQFLKVVQPYTLLAIVDAKVGAFGGMTFSERDLLAGGVTIEDAKHNIYAPLADDAVSADLKNLLTIMKPVLGNSLGNMGAHFEFFAFPAEAKEGGRLADAERDGAFAVHVLDLTFHYRLPLGSLLPAQLDSKTGESFPGNYHFNPFTGDKLKPQPAATPQAAGKT